MLQKKGKNKPGNATHAIVKREMAKPSIARSARITELNLDATRIREQASTTLPVTADKVIPSPRPSQAEETQIAVDRADRPHRDFRI
jgi:hypothetical protein